MTKFDERLLGKRINVFSESQSVAVQELLFKMGCSWITYNTGKKKSDTLRLNGCLLTHEDVYLIQRDKSLVNIIHIRTLLQ